ncbi:MAG TPA: BACON domain-containing carbohydrate-binding protein [Pyrinomonadaceae bacterium]
MSDANLQIFNPSFSGLIFVLLSLVSLTCVTIYLSANNKAVLGGRVKSIGKMMSLVFFSFSLLFITCGKTQAQWSVDSFNPNASDFVHSVVIQQDGKILIGGDFTSLGGQSRSRIARLNTDGSLDESFNPNANNRVNKITIQPDGKILVAGSFTSIAGQTRYHLARLNPDGTLDSSFADPNIGNQFSEIYSTVLQPDGKILIGGTFPTVGGQARRYMARLNSDGSLDNSFNPDPNSSVAEIVVKPDGKILFSGVFKTVSGQNRFGLAQINADGSLDAAFNPISSFDSGFVWAILLQPDGKILLGGNGIIMGRQNLARIHADGSLDTSFSSLTFDYGIDDLARQPDGSILIAGGFSLVNGQTRKGLAKLSADGLLDPFFYPNTGNTNHSAAVLTIAVQPDGKILVGGAFNIIGGQTRNNIARIIASSSAENPIPSISGISHNSVVPGAVPFELIVNGNYFVPNTVIRLNGQDKNTVVVSPTQLKTQITASDLQTAGQYAVTVFNPAPGGGEAGPFYFFYDCTNSINPPFQNISRTGESGSFSVTAASGCGWNATSNAPWITVTSGNGTGNGTVNFTVAANAGQARRGTITVAGHTFTVNQDGECAFFLTPENMSVGWSSSGEASFYVETQVGCTWRPISNVPWLTIADAGSGNGNGTVKFRYSYNDGNPRTGTITLGDKTFTVNQGSSCSYSIVTPTGNNSTTVPASGGTGSVFIRTTGDSGCYRDNSFSYRVTVPWITVSNGFNGFNFSVDASDGQTRSGEIIITAGNGQILTYRIFQSAGCPYTLTSANQNFGASGGNGNLSVTTASGCTWTAATNENWITLTSGQTGNGSGTVGFSVAGNSGPARTGTISVGDRTLTVTQISGCAFTVTPNSQLFASSGGTGNFLLNASDSSCSWQVTYNVDWIWGFQVTSGNGSRSFSFSVGPNAGAARATTITVGGQVFTVNQAGNCTYSLSQANANIQAIGESSSFNVVSAAGCAWSAVSNDSWITVTSGNGTGNGTVSFTVQPNNGSARTGTISVGNQTFTVNQSPGNCSFILSPTSVNVGVAGGSAGFNINTANGCAWTAVSNHSWITVTSNSSGSGAGTVSYSIQPNNSGTARQGTITAGGQTFTINQSATCTYALTPSNVLSGADGGSNAFQINTSSDCAWNASSTDSWITITTGTGTGNGTVSFTVQANTAQQTRTGTILVGGQTFTVNQSAATVALKTRFDFDGDGKADVSVYRPSLGAWYVNKSSDNAFSGMLWGLPGDVITPADFDGDGRTDAAVFRDGFWYWMNSSNNSFSAVKFGQTGDTPIPSDYDGDGKADVAVFRENVPGAGNRAYFYILQSSDNSFRPEQFGSTGDKPVSADFDKDGKADLAVYRDGSLAGGKSYFFYRSTAQPGVGFNTIQWGVTGDKPAPADFDGDGKQDAAVFRPSTGDWHILNSSDNQFTAFHFGISEDVPVAADYDGDGKADMAVFRPSTGSWYLQRSTQGFTGMQFGVSSDKPIPALIQ